MTLNILQDITLVLFVISCLWIIFRERNLRLGIIVKENDWIYTNGKQGVLTTIGRCSNADVKLKDRSVSRLQAVIAYNPKTHRYDMTEYGKSGSCSNGYHIANHSLQFTLPCEERCFEFGFVTLMFSLVFVALQSYSSYRCYGIWQVFIPYLILQGYIIVSNEIRADKQPITESILAIFLTYYIEATLYDLSDDELFNGILSATLGVSLYIVFSFAMRLFLKYCLGDFSVHCTLRTIAVFAIIVLIVLNLALAKEKNGAYNWISLGSITFQPSEIVKILLAFVLIVPTGKHFYSINNIAIILGTTILCFVYALLIKDVGVLLQFGLLFVISVLIQNSNILYSILMIVAGIAGCKGVLYISSTAASRIKGWLGESTTLFEGLTASGVFDNPDTYGYQSIHALVAAFKNGALFGNSGFDVLNGIEAANSDLVISMIAQKHGSFVIYLILALYIVLIINTIFCLRQKDKIQQLFSCVGITLLVFAMALNLCGTFGIVALTGVVNPAISDGISAAVSYGCVFGVLGSTSITKQYLETIQKGAKNHVQ